MALKLQATSAYGTATLPTSTGNNWTIAGNIKLEAANNQGCALFGGAFATSALGILASSVDWRLLRLDEYVAADATVDPAASWEYLAVSHVSGGTFRVHHITAAGAYTLIESNVYGSDLAAISLLTLGTTNTIQATWDSLVCRLAHVKYWKSTALSSAQLEAERVASTPVLAASGYWPLTTGSTTADSIGSATITLSGSTSFVDDEPAYITAGASAVKPAQRAISYLRNQV